MDEPASALDPIATLAIEDLIAELKKNYTIVIVTHNMQQAARSSDFTAFFNIEKTGAPGMLVEIDETSKIFSNPTDKRTDRIGGEVGMMGMFLPGWGMHMADVELVLGDLLRLVAQVGGD